jgi:Ferritin-like domain
MIGRGRTEADGRLTRAALFRAAIGGGAVAAGGVALGARGGGTTEASPSRSSDDDILNVFLQLEYAQQDLYRAALRTDVLPDDLREYAGAASRQEDEHVAFLRRRLGDRAHARKTGHPEKAVSTPAAFRQAAVDIEEGALAVYIGQAANLTGGLISPIAEMVSVEARQAAWIRDLAGVSPAPNAADPSRPPDAVLADLRSKGLLA